jgi:hypothetical protein
MTNNLSHTQPPIPDPSSPIPTSPTFIHFYDTLVSSGLLARLSGSALKILTVLGLAASPLGTGTARSRAFFRDLLAAGIVTPTDRGRLFCGLRHHELACRAGIGKNTVTRATSQLQALGLVEKRVVARPDGTRYNLFFLLPASHLDKFNTLRPPASQSPIPKTGTVPPAVPVPIPGTNYRKQHTTTAVATQPAGSDEFDPLALLAHFARRQGLAHYRPTAHDRRKLDLLRRRGYTQAQVLAAIDGAFDRRPADAPPIRMFSYCATIALASPPVNAPQPTAHHPPVAATGIELPDRQASAAPPLSPVHDLPPRLAILYESEIGPLSPLIRRELAGLAAAHPDPAEWDAAFREAARANVRRISYVQKVLEARLARQAHSPAACHLQPGTPSGGNRERTEKPSRNLSGGRQHRRAKDGTRDINSHNCTGEELLAIQRAAAAVEPLDPAKVLGHGQ